MGSLWVDILAVSFFVIEWVAYGFRLERTAYGRNSLSSRMNVYREVLFFTTTLVVVVTWRRQFASNAWRAMGS
jgi:uncharacterized membrane protein